MECHEDKCEICGRIDEEPFEINIQRVRGLNKPYTRHGLVFGHILIMIDSMIEITTLGYFRSDMGGEWIKRDLDKFSQYKEEENEGSKKQKFKLEKLKFKIFRMRDNRSSIFTISEQIIGDVCWIMDSMVGIMTFAYFDSDFIHQWSSRQGRKLMRYIKKYGITHL